MLKARVKRLRTMNARAGLPEILRNPRVTQAELMSEFRIGMYFDDASNKSYKISVSHYPSIRWFAQEANYTKAGWIVGRAFPLTKAFFQKLRPSTIR